MEYMSDDEISYMEKDIPLSMEYLNMIDDEIESQELSVDNPSDRIILSKYARKVGMFLFDQYYYRVVNTTRYLNLWKWWASTHNIPSHNFDYYWDHVFI
jgi:hypothetical protein